MLQAHQQGLRELHHGLAGLLVHDDAGRRLLLGRRGVLDRLLNGLDGRLLRSK